jgi:uncharacterized membrane protein
MTPLFVLAVSFVAFRLTGFGIVYFANWQHALRAALGVMFLLTASAHWGRRRPDLIRMVPAVLNDAGFWVTLTGIAELAVAVGLQVRKVALGAGVAAGAMLIAMSPANAKAARERLTIGDRPVPALRVRLMIQLIFLGAIGAAVWPH